MRSVTVIRAPEACASSRQVFTSAGSGAHCAGEMALKSIPIFADAIISELATLLCASPRKHSFISDSGFCECSRIVSMSANACVG